MKKDPLRADNVLKNARKIHNSIVKTHKKLRHWVKKNYKAIITVVAAVVVIYFTAGAGSAWAASLGTYGSAAVSGAGVGAGVSASSTAIQGGSWRDIGRSALSGAATGAITAGVATGLHGIAATAGTQFTTGLGKHILHAAAHGATGGAMSAAMGGSFKDRFIGSAAGAFLSPLSGAMGPGAAGTGSWGQVAARTALSAAIGGTASVLGGGKFASGAITAGFLHLYNDESVMGYIRRHGEYKEQLRQRQATREAYARYSAERNMQKFGEVMMVGGFALTAGLTSTALAVGGAELGAAGYVGAIGLYTNPGMIVAGNAALDGVLLAGTGGAAGATAFRAVRTAPSFFEGASYTPKVLKQMGGKVGEFHSFPESVTAFESAGMVRSLMGGDKAVRQVLEIPESYGSGGNGVFRFIKNANGTINERLFVPNSP